MSKNHKNKLTKMVRAVYGAVPPELEVAIDECAQAMETRDTLWAQISTDGTMITEVGSTGQVTMKQHPLLPAYYQQQGMVQSYLKELGLSKRKAAIKVADDDDDKKDDFTVNLQNKMQL